MQAAGVMDVAWGMQVARDTYEARVMDEARAEVAAWEGAWEELPSSLA